MDIPALIERLQKVTRCDCGFMDNENMLGHRSVCSLFNPQHQLLEAARDALTALSAELAQARTALTDAGIPAEYRHGQRVTIACERLTTLSASHAALTQKDHDHETCIKEMELSFDESLDRLLDRAEAAKAQVAALTTALTTAEETLARWRPMVMGKEGGGRA
jgi:hypothetical protein